MENEKSHSTAFSEIVVVTPFTTLTSSTFVVVLFELSSTLKFTMNYERLFIIEYYGTTVNSK